MKIFIESNLVGKDLSNLMKFVTSKSTKFSMSRYYNGKIDNDLVYNMQNKYKNFLYNLDKERRTEYIENVNDCRKDFQKTLRINSIKDAMLYFDDILEQELAFVDSIDISGTDIPFQTLSEDFIGTEFTRYTPVSRMSVFEICYFKIGTVCHTLLEKMDCLYTYPHTLEGVKFDDLTFYRNDNPVFAICAHEYFSYLNIDENEYKEFLELNINHTL